MVVPTTELTLIGKPGCHLCDEARVVVAEVLQAFDDSASGDAPAVRLTEQSILDDAALADRYADDIPVLLIDGEVHSIHRVDAGELRARIEAAAS